MTVRTSPFAQVSTTFVVTSATPAANGSPQQPGIIVYKMGIVGKADAYGLATADLNIKYHTTTPLVAGLIVVVRSPHQSVTKTIPFVFVPLS